MKDEFMNEWMASSRDAKDELNRRLFRVLDIVHEECQTSVQNCMNGEAASCFVKRQADVCMDSMDHVYQVRMCPVRFSKSFG